MKTKSDELIQRIQHAILPWDKQITKKRMFGGYCFLYNGKMCIGENKNRLMVRVIAEKMEEVMKMNYVGPMDFTGTALKEFIFVTESGVDTNEKLQYFIELGIEHAISKSKN